MWARRRVVRWHHAGKCWALDASEAFTRQLVGPGGEDRTELLELLFEALRRTPELRHRWRDDDVVAWDNLVTQHFACFDFEGERRVVHSIDVR